MHTISRSRQEITYTQPSWLTAYQKSVLKHGATSMSHLLGFTTVTFNEWLQVIDNSYSTDNAQVKEVVRIISLCCMDIDSIKEPSFELLDSMKGRIHSDQILELEIRFSLTTDQASHVYKLWFENVL